MCKPQAISTAMYHQYQMTDLSVICEFLLLRHLVLVIVSVKKNLPGIFFRCIRLGRDSRDLQAMLLGARPKLYYSWWSIHMYPRQWLVLLHTSITYYASPVQGLTISKKCQGVGSVLYLVCQYAGLDVGLGTSCIQAFNCSSEPDVYLLYFSPLYIDKTCLLSQLEMGH